MKILLVHNFYQQPGGERIVVDQQSNLLKNRGNTVIAFTRDSKEIENFGTKEKILFFPNTIYNRDSLNQLRVIIERENPDIAHVHNVFPLLSPSIYYILHDYNIPIVQSIHNFRFLCPNGLFYINDEICERCKFGNTLHAIIRKCYRQSYLMSSLYAFSIGSNRLRGWFNLIDKFIALTEFVASKLVESGAIASDKISVLGNFLPDSYPIATKVCRDETAYVLYLGRLSPEKGILTLIKSIEDIPELVLKIGGDGPQRSYLEKYINERKIPNVEFLGFVGGEKKWHLLNNAMTTVIPSECYETFGLSALESLAVGTPVIASDIGSLPNLIINEHNGLLFKAGDSQDLSARLRQIISAPNLREMMSKNAKITVKTKFSEEIHYKELMKIYAEVKG